MKKLLMDTINTKTINGVSAVVTALGNNVATKVIEQVSDLDEATLQDLFYDNGMLREYIVNTNLLVDLDTTGVAADEDTVTKALKSQQSKRSKAMAVEIDGNSFMKVISATVGEMLIREVNGLEYNAKAKATKGHSLEELTEEVLAEYKADQEALRKAIRNVQAKKCNAKKKGLADTSEEMIEIFALEEKLMSVRETPARKSGTRTTKVDPRIDHIAGIFNANIIDKKTKKDDLLAIIDQVKEIIGYTEADVETEAE